LKGDHLRAATTLRDGETFQMGDVTAAAWAMREPSFAGRSLGEVTLGAERDAFAFGTRRYEATAAGRRVEVTVLERDAFEAHEIDPWRARMEKSELLSPELIARGELDGCFAIAERVPAGIRLAALLESIESERIAISPELTLAVLRRLAQSLSVHHDAIGPHAGLVPGAVQLTMDGDVILLRSGPRPTDPIAEVEWCSEMRRMNLPPSIGDDAFALARIAEALGGPELGGELPEPESVRTRGAFSEWTARLVALSDRWRVDPSAAHVARVVRLLSDRGRPLAVLRNR
jgi:hypothetical protein